jgi:hypothetical protein
LPDKLRKKELARQEREYGGYRDSVILDAADEAIYKASRRASRNLNPVYNTVLASPTSRGSMDSDRSNNSSERPSSISRAMMESFRWMDEDDDLDLRLVLDDYHANLDGVVIPSPSSTQRPSFRRHMSVSKAPFGRASLSSINHTSPTREKGPHSRQKSRTMSLIHPKHAVNDSISSIDPHATHYQDPEARLKLRVYLASPQKFDEAIEFGFPSAEGVTDTADKENKVSRKISKDSGYRRSPLTDCSQTFLNDTTSIYSSDASMLDPEEPLTPSELDTSFKRGQSPTPRRSNSATDFAYHRARRPVVHKQGESYSQASAGSREMTLRMTLTRPDLRADESLIYGWQPHPMPNVAPSPGLMMNPNANSRPRQSEDLLALESLPNEKIEMRGPFGGVDGWGPADREEGVVKRMWKRVRSSQRKST